MKRLKYIVLSHLKVHYQLGNYVCTYPGAGKDKLIIRRDTYGMFQVIKIKAKEC